MLRGASRGVSSNEDFVVKSVNDVGVVAQYQTK